MPIYMCYTHADAIQLTTYTIKVETAKNVIKEEENLVTYPMPRVPPVTSAVSPLRDHLLSLQLCSASAINCLCMFKFGCMYMVLYS